MVDDRVEGDLERGGVALHLGEQKSSLEGGQGGGGEFGWVGALAEPAAAGHCVQAQADARFPSEERCGDVSACDGVGLGELAAFQRATDKLDDLGVKVLALSVDDEATTRELIAKHDLTFPVGHSADAAALHEATGSFVNADPAYLQSTGFVLDPEGKVIVSVASSGAIGRLLPEDVAGLVNYLKSEQPA